MEDLPRFHDLVATSFRENKVFSLWTRNTIPWALECEQGGLNRQEALEKVQNPERRETLETGVVGYGAAGYSQEIKNTSKQTASLCFVVFLIALLTPTGACCCMA